MCNYCVCNSRIIKDGRLGTLRWIGVLKGKKDTYYGIELDIDSGKNNGSYLGKTYFKCDEGKGVFITPLAVESVIFITLEFRNLI